MKKKNIIIIVSVAVVLAGIITAYFTVPVSYAGTIEKCGQLYGQLFYYEEYGQLYKYEVAEFKLLLPVEAQARQVMEGNMNYKQILDTLGLPQKKYTYGKGESATYMTEFHLRSGHRLWLISGSDSEKLGEIAHSDFPFQTYENYRKSKGVE